MFENKGIRCFFVFSTPNCGERFTIFFKVVKRTSNDSSFNKDSIIGRIFWVILLASKKVPTLHTISAVAERTC